MSVAAAGAGAPADLNEPQSPETYLGYLKASGNNNPDGLIEDRTHVYPAAGRPAVSHWTLGGAWTLGAEAATSNAAQARITYRFRGRDLHLVLGPGANGRAARFRIRLDGQAPADDHGVDAAGAGTASEHRLYQLVRQRGSSRARTFEIEFLGPGVQAFAFTFG